MTTKLIDVRTPGYDRWCAAARRAHLADWDTAKPEVRDPWIAAARQSEIDADARRMANRAAAEEVAGMSPAVKGP
jgi:hypothetical protein